MDFTFDVRERREGGGRGRCAGCGPSREKLLRKEALPGEGCDVMVLPVLPTRCLTFPSFPFPFHVLDSKITYQKPRVVDLPLAVGEMAAFGLSQLPNPLLTIDDAKLM